MKILYDLSYTQNRDFYSGLYEYGKKVFNEILKKYGNDISILLIKDEKMDQFILDSKCNIIYVDFKYGTKAFWKSVSKILLDFDRVYFPYQLIKNSIKIPNSCELYFTIHDLAQLNLATFSKINKEEKYYYTGKNRFIKYPVKQILRFTGLFKFYLKRNLKKNIKRANKIITISNYSKEQIIKEFKIDSDKIVVSYAPLKLLSSTDAPSINYTNYFLFVSASRYTKNTYRGLKALDEIWDENDQFPQAIVTGALPNCIYDRLKHKEKVISLGYVSEADLEYLYKNANALIFTSLCEGFGSPPLEAMRYGTRVVSSNAMSLKELYSDTLLFNPYDVNDIKNKILAYGTISNDKMIEIFNRVNNKCEEDLSKLVDIIVK